MRSGRGSRRGSGCRRGCSAGSGRPRSREPSRPLRTHRPERADRRCRSWRRERWTEIPSIVASQPSPLVTPFRAPLPSARIKVTAPAEHSANGLLTASKDAVKSAGEAGRVGHERGDSAGGLHHPGDADRAQRACFPEKRSASERPHPQSVPGSPARWAMKAAWSSRGPKQGTTVASSETCQQAIGPGGSGGLLIRGERHHGGTATRP